MKAVSVRRVVGLSVLAFATSTATMVACVGDDGVPPGGVTTPDAGTPDTASTAPPPAQGSALGAACTTDATCASGHCADGVCCDTACNGVCESCALAQKGTCSAIPANTDPENECINLARDLADAGSYDAGTGDAGDAGIGGNAGPDLPPDGGSLDLTACAGTCNGSRACAYPAAETTCGPAFCHTPTTPESYHCDGKAGCVSAKSSCTDYTCNDSSGVCRPNCGSNSDCQDANYCNGSNVCAPKKADGTPCTVSAECTNGFCVHGTNASVCCNSACNETGMQCDATGQEGKCSCSGVTCATGVACQLFYVDGDGDGQGDVSGTLGANTAIAGCSGPASIVATTGPNAGKTFYAKPTDCDDSNPDVFKGQSAYFDHATLKGSWDYDCSGAPDKEQPEYPGRTCQVCELSYPGGNLACVANATCGGQCCGKTSYAGFECGFGCPNGAGGYECCPLGPTVGFEQTVNCGDTAPWHVCGYCQQSPSTSPAQTIDDGSATKTQRCH